MKRSDRIFWNVFGAVLAAGLVMATARLASVWYATRAVETELQKYADRARERQKAREQARAQRERELERSAAMKAAEEEKRHRRFLEARARDQTEGEYFPPADDSIPELGFACKDGKIVRRVDGSWTVTVLGNGAPARCRIVP